MENIEQFIESGMLELYCLNRLNNAELREVERMAALHPAVKSELEKIEDTLADKALQESKTTPDSLRYKMQLSIEAASLGLPPLLSKVSDVNEWDQYLREENIYPSEVENFLWVDLPSSDKVITYAVWAEKGVTVEESHADEDERLLMLQGACFITVNGITTQYRTGDLVHIPAKTFHKAESCSDELMVLVGQRLKIEVIPYLH